MVVFHTGASLSLGKQTLLHARQFYVNSKQARVIWKEKTSIDKMSLPDWPVVKPIIHFLDDWYLRTQLTIGSITTWAGCSAGIWNILSKPQRGRQQTTFLHGICISSYVQVLALRSCSDFFLEGLISGCACWNKHFHLYSDIFHGIVL